jgi:hypothetical protein
MPILPTTAKPRSDNDHVTQFNFELSGDDHERLNAAVRDAIRERSFQIVGVNNSKTVIIWMMPHKKENM